MNDKTNKQGKDFGENIIGLWTTCRSKGPLGGGGGDNNEHMIFDHYNFQIWNTS
jgi:hypothetical protein